MKLTLSDAKMFLRVDSNDEDEAVIIPIIATAKQLVKDVARAEEDFFDADDVAEEVKEENPVVKAAAYHAIAYLYEHRETADMNALTLQLRSMLFGVREAAF